MHFKCTWDDLYDDRILLFQNIDHLESPGEHTHTLHSLTCIAQIMGTRIDNIQVYPNSNWSWNLGVHLAAGMDYLTSQPVIPVSCEWQLSACQVRHVLMGFPYQIREKKTFFQRKTEVGIPFEVEFLEQTNHLENLSCWVATGTSRVPKACIYYYRS